MQQQQEPTTNGGGAAQQLSENKTYSIQQLSDFKAPILEIIREMGIESFSDDQVRGMYIFGSQAYFSKMKKTSNSIEPTTTTTETKDEHGNELITVCYRNDQKEEVIQYLADSDFDIILVVDDYKSEDKLLGALASDMQSKWEPSISIKTCLGEEHQFDLDVSVYNTKYFVSYMHYHQPVYNQSVTSYKIDEFYIIYEDERMKYFRKNWCIHHLNIPRLIEANSDEIDYCLEKSQRFLTLSQGGSYSNERESFQDAYKGYFSNRTSQSLLKTAKKNIVHAKRKLFFSKQMLANNEIVNYAEMNDYQDFVFERSEYMRQWRQFEEAFLPEFDKLKLDFATICNTIIDVALVLLEKQKSAIDFLNNYCTTKNQGKLREQINKKLSSMINKKCKKVAKLTEIESYITNLFMNGIYVLGHLSGMRIVPFQVAHDTSSSTIENANLFQCSIPVGGSHIGQLHPHLMALDGSIIKFQDEKYSLVSYTCGYTVDLRDSTLPPRNDDYLYCFKLPYGKKVSLFFHDNEWKVSCPELDYLNWIDWPLKNPSITSSSCWRDEFWRVWKEQGISLEELQQKETLLYIWNENQVTLIEKFGGNESILSLRASENNNNTTSKHKIIQEDTNLTLYIKDDFSLANWKQRMIEESLKLNPKEYSGFLFLQDGNGGGKVTYHLSSPLHYIIPRLKLANKFYSGADVLNEEVFEHCSDFSLLQNKENDNWVISCAVLEYEPETVVEECFSMMNPVFRQYCSMIRKELAKDENKKHIPLLKQAALSLEFDSQIEDIIDEMYYNAIGDQEMHYDDEMDEEEE